MENLLIKVTSIFNNAIRHDLKIHSVVTDTDKNRIIIYFENGTYLIDVADVGNIHIEFKGDELSIVIEYERNSFDYLSLFIENL